MFLVFESLFFLINDIILFWGVGTDNKLKRLRGENAHQPQRLFFPTFSWFGVGGSERVGFL